MAPTTRVQCEQYSCAFYNRVSGDTLCHCSHPEKPHHMTDDACPLYRMDWSKAAAREAELRKRFGVK